jgi:hypothetical protein
MGVAIMTFSRGQGFVIGRIDSEAQLMTEKKVEQLLQFQNKP